MSTYREDIAELISAQIQVALKNEYDRGWKEGMEYYWKQREIDDDRQDYDRYKKGVEIEYDEDKDPYAG